MPSQKTSSLPVICPQFLIADVLYGRSLRLKGGMHYMRLVMACMPADAGPWSLIYATLIAMRKQIWHP